METASIKEDSGIVTQVTQVVTWCRVIRHRAGRSYRNNLVNSLMAQHTCLHSSALEDKQTQLLLWLQSQPEPSAAPGRLTW